VSFRRREYPREILFNASSSEGELVSRKRVNFCSTFCHKRRILVWARADPHRLTAKTWSPVAAPDSALCPLVTSLFTQL
jgi:hypothetical protein